MASILVHPNYYSPGVFYDLALLQLTSNADLNKPNIGLGCLPSIGTGTTTGDTFVVDQCVVTGWGKETFGDSGISAILKKIQVVKQALNDINIMFDVQDPLIDHLE